MHSETGEILSPIELIIRPQTPQEEFDYLLYLLGRAQFYKQNGYAVELPEQLEFQKIATGQTLLETVDKNELHDIFISKVYNQDFFKAGMKALEEVRGQIIQAFPKFVEFNEQWGFKVFPEYQLTLTRYGPGGIYLEDEGRVVMMTRKDGTFKRPHPTHTSVHEMVHLGIESNIVKQHSLTHWEKERTVDKMCLLKFGDILPNYQPHSKGDPRVDPFVTEATISDLPSAIGQYVKEYPREHKF